MCDLCLTLRILYRDVSSEGGWDGSVLKYVRIFYHVLLLYIKESNGRNSTVLPCQFSSNTYHLEVHNVLPHLCLESHCTNTHILYPHCTFTTSIFPLQIHSPNIPEILSFYQTVTSNLCCSLHFNMGHKTYVQTLSSFNNVSMFGSFT